MAHSFWEGGTGGDQKSNDDDCDSFTSKWLIENKLSHLQKAFAAESITIQELQEMNEKDLEDVLNELVEDKDIAFKKRDKIRMESRLKATNKKQQKSPSKDSKSSQPLKQSESSQVQFSQIIITEAEQMSMKSLTNKFDELESEQKGVEGAIDNLKQEHLKQQQVINGAFTEIIKKIEQRRSGLLKDMEAKVIKYNDELNEALKQIANNRNKIGNTQQKYEQNIKESAKLGSSILSAEFDLIQQRANANVKLIDEALLEIGKTGKYEIQSTDIVFDFNKDEMGKKVEEWGGVKLKKDEPVNAYIPGLINEGIMDTGFPYI